MSKELTDRQMQQISTSTYTVVYPKKCCLTCIHCSDGENCRVANSYATVFPTGLCDLWELDEDSRRSESGV